MRLTALLVVSLVPSVCFALDVTPGPDAAAVDSGVTVRPDASAASLDAAASGIDAGVPGLDAASPAPDAAQTTFDGGADEGSGVKGGCSCASSTAAPLAALVLLATPLLRCRRTS